MNSNSRTPTYPPSTSRGGTSLVQTTCAYCGVGCGVDIEVNSGVATGLQGTPEHPANFGRLCVKGTHLLDTVDHQGRLLVPEVDGMQTSWDNAASYVANKFNDIINTYDKDSVAFYVSGQLLTEDYYLANKLMKGYIGSANIDTNSRLCMSSAVSAYKRAFGEDVVPCSYEDLEHTDLIVLIGSNAAWTHPVLFQRIERAKAINPELTVVVVDPRKSATAECADIYLAITPGSDAALYSGLLHYLKENELVDSDFVRYHTEGFEETIEAASAWTLEKVANFCGVSVSELTVFYRLFAGSERAVSMYSMGVNQSTSGVDKCHSIINAHLASGKIGKTGSGPFSITGQPNAMGGREVGGLANQLAAHLDIEKESHRELVQTFWQSPTIADKQGAKAIDLFDQILEGKIKAVWVMATNPLVSLPDSNKIRAAMEKCEFVVVSDCVSDNDTLAYADVKLPATPWLEKNGTVTNSERRISRQRSCVAPAGKAKHDWDIIALIARKMGFSGFDYQHPYQVFNEFTALTAYQNNGGANHTSDTQDTSADHHTRRLLNLAGLTKLTLSEYDNLQPVQWPVKSRQARVSKTASQPLFADGFFPTTSGKAKFFPIVPKLPVQQRTDKFPFVLNSGRYRDQWHTMTRTGKASALTQHLAKPYLSVNKADGNKLGIVDDGLVEVKSSQGTIIVPAKLTDTVASGHCFMPIHWNRMFASNAVVTSLYQSQVDPISGQPEAKHTGVQLNPIVFSQYISIYTRDDLQLCTDYWLKAKLAECHYAQLANHEGSALSMAEIQMMAHCAGEWLSIHDAEKNITRALCFSQGAIDCVVEFSAEPFVQANQDVADCFAQEQLTVIDAMAFLKGLGDDSRDKARKQRQVCSCFGVKEASIIEAIEQGCDSVTALGSKLKCGTNCGSCKPELQSLINEVETTRVSTEETGKACQDEQQIAVVNLL